MTANVAIQVIQEAQAWVAKRDDVFGLAICGSYARGDPKSDSDLDLCLFVEEPRAYLTDTTWLSQFGIPESIQEEDWGAVKSLRVSYESGLEVEFGLAKSDWASISPVDPGTRRVVSQGFLILYDRDDLLQKLCHEVAASAGK